MNCVNQRFNSSISLGKSFETALQEISSNEKKIICVFGSLYQCGSVLNKN